MAFRDPFKLVPINNIAQFADKFTRNEILTSNEVRQIIGFKPSADPKADELRNSNISQANERGAVPSEPSGEPTEEGTPVEYEETAETDAESMASFGDIPISELM